MKVFFLFIFLHLHTVFSYTVTMTLQCLAYAIKDLEGKIQSDFLQEMAQWTINNDGTQPTASLIYQPSGTSIYFFGKSYTSMKSFERTYNAIPAHNFITFTLTLYSGGWYSSSVAEIDFDSVMRIAPEYNWAREGNGGSGPFGPLQYKGSVSHLGTAGSSLNLRIKASLGDDGMESTWFGFRELSLYFHKDYTGGINTTMCQISPAKSYVSDQCACGISQGANSNTGLCETCATGCNFCIGSASDQCLTCNPTTFWDGTRCACLATEFLYDEGKCQLDCPGPLSVYTQSGLKYCKNPCYSSNTYLFPDGTCSNACNSYLQTKQERGNKYCSSSCTLNTDFLYPDGSCRSACIYPLSSKTEFGIKYCFSPCSSTQYLFPDASCNTCDSPLVKKTELGVKFCSNPCISGSSFLYPDGSCSATCNFPLSNRIESIAKFCYSPCSSSSEFLYHDGTCKSACDFPLSNKVETVAKFCFNPCSSSSEFLYPDGSCSTACDLPFSNRNEPIAKFCYSPCSSNNTFLFPNGSCSGACSLPLSNKIQSTMKLCFNPCPSNNDFLYPDGLCSSSCAFPLLNREEQVARFCFSPCSSNNAFLYPDGTCKSACDFPLSNRVESVAKFCFSPCSSSSEFLYPDSSCSSSCDFPLSQRNEPVAKFCYSPCSSSSEFLYPDSTCKSDCDFPLSNRVESVAKFCLNPCTSTSDFLYPDGSCSDTCNFPLSNRQEPIAKFCFSTCSSSSEFLYPNGTCQGTCDFPLSNRVESVGKLCLNPCTSTTDFLYPNGSCSNTCGFPLSNRVEPIAKFCFNSCPSTNDFLYPNQTCLDTCAFPLSTKTESVANFCYSPCSSSTDYLYPAGNCSNQCPFPFLQRTEQVAHYCFPPCDSPNLYRYNNGSCDSNCPYPYVKSQLNSINLCKPPCDNSQHYLYETEQVCTPTCVSPFEPKQIETIKICFLTVQVTIQEAQSAQATVAAVASQGEATQTAMKATTSFNSGNPALALLAGQASLLFYIRYINLNYPAKLKLVFILQDASPFSFSVGIKMPGSLEATIKDRPLPPIFEEYELHSDFLYNSWDTLSSLALVLLIILVLSVLKVFTKKCPRIHKIIAQALSILKWNIPLTIVCGALGDIYFYASLHLQSKSFDSSLEIISMVLSISMALLGVGILILNIKIVKDIFKPTSKREQATEEEEEAEGKWKSYELLFDAYEKTSFLSFSYMALFLSRTIVFNLIIANLYNYPLAQAILINVVSLIMFVYLMITRPLKNLLEFVQLFLNEILVIIINICVLIIAIMDELHMKGPDLRNTIGETVITIFFIFTTLSLVFVAIQVLFGAYFLYKLLKQLKSQGALNPSGVIKAIFGQENKTTSFEKNNKLESKIQKTRLKFKKIKRMNYSQSQVASDFNATTVNPKDTTSEIFNFHSDPNISNILPNHTFDMLNHSKMESMEESMSKPKVNQNFRRLTLETNCNNSSHIINLAPTQIRISEKRSSDVNDTISQFRKLRNYMRRNQELKQ